MTPRILTRRHRSRGHPAALLAALLTLGACAGRPAAPLAPPSRAAARPSAASPPPAISPSALERLHEEVRVAGLADRRFDHDTYWRAIRPFLGGTVRVLPAGVSAEGREIFHLTYGSGPVRVLLWSQMHGNESTASMALADIVRFFAEHPEHPLARRIARGATIHMIPMLNPDGAQRFRRRNAQGVDINRYARRLQTPEGRVLKAVRDAVQPDFGFNLHDQGTAVRVGDSDRGVAIALLAPAFDSARSVDAKRRRAMQVASVIVEAVDPFVGGHVARYDDTFNPRAFGDLIGAWGASTVLIESGGWKDDPQKQYLRMVNFVGILTALDAIATGRYTSFTPDAYQRLEQNGRRIPDLLIAGGTLAVPGLPPLQADVLVNYARPLLREGGTIADIGDLGGVQAQDTLRIDGLYLIPMPDALGGDGAIEPGMPAHFVVAEDPAGRRVKLQFRGGPGTR